MPVRILKDESGKEYVAYPSEFRPSDSRETALARKILGDVGRMVGGSKSVYLYDNPKNLVVFNANVCIRSAGKIWYGDIDVTNDIGALKELAKKLNQTVYVLYEMAARFENEKDPRYSDFAVTVSADETIVTKFSESIYIKDGIPYIKTEEELEASRPKPEAVHYNERDFDAIDLPDLKSIKALKKSDPLSQFQDYFVKKYGKEKATQIYQSLYVTSSYYDGLKNLAIKYAKKTHPNLHPAKLNQSVSWYMFEMSPNSFKNEQVWEKPEMGYVKKK